LNVHVEFPLLQRLALPITVGTTKFPGIKIHDTRMVRLMEVLLHGGTTVGGSTAKQVHGAILPGKGTKVSLTFVLFHQRLCGPLANSLFHHQPNSDARPNSIDDRGIPVDIGGCRRAE
jgi:hypothetical protein